MSTTEIQSSPAKSAVPFGLLFGVLIIFIMFSMYYFDINIFENKQASIFISIATNLFLPILLICFAVYDFKNKANHGFLTIVEALKVGVTLMVIGAVISGIYNVVFN